MSQPKQAQGRYVAMLCLTLATGFLFWGSLVFRFASEGALGRAYWAICGTMGFLAAVVASRETVRTLSQMKEERRQAWARVTQR